VPITTPTDIAAPPDMEDTTEIDLTTAESNGEAAIVERETVTD
jgi:hypothetical protein